MKKLYTILLAWFVALGAMAEVAIGTQVSVSMEQQTPRQMGQPMGRR